MNKVSFVDYIQEYNHIGKETLKAIEKALSKGDLILREDVETFEKDFAKYIGTKYSIGVNSCTDALVIALRACGIKQGDEVITVSHTFWATIEAIVHCGATPVLMDVGNDYLMKAHELEEFITEKTKAIIPVHFNGRVCDMDMVMKIAKKHNLYVIEDAAQAIGATFRGNMAGSFGDAGCFSFYPSKILGAYGDGGIITTNNPYIKRQAWLLRAHGQGIKTKDYPILGYGWSSRLQNIQAAALNVKMKYLGGWIKRRKEIAGIYDEGLKNTVKIPPQSSEYNNDSYQNYVIRAEKRDGLFEHLKENGIETLIKDPVPNHLQPAFTERYGIKKLSLSEQLCEEVISLPMHPYLTDEEVNYVIIKIREFYEKS